MQKYTKNGAIQNKNKRNVTHFAANRYALVFQ